ncbi:hypothetical protein SAMN05216303_105315 [Rhodoferax sp. OV413]|nr:hypothetical protein SAMN05216303_105315 [Rhodoferax sp. OV413]
MDHDKSTSPATPWNKGKIVGQKAPFKMRDIWAIRVRLQMQSRRRELAISNAIWFYSCTHSRYKTR